MDEHPYAIQGVALAHLRTVLVAFKTFFPSNPPNHHQYQGITLR